MLTRYDEGGPIDVPVPFPRFLIKETVLIDLLDQAIAESLVATEHARRVTERVKVRLHSQVRAADESSEGGGGRHD
jgi:hypothetical protein